MTDDMFGSTEPEPKQQLVRAGFFKCMRNSEALELIAKHPPSFILLYIIAFRANRHDAFNQHDLGPGQAFVGDYKRIGLTERTYRTAKQILEKHGFATFTPTSKGTVATLLNTRVFDVNLEQGDGRNDEQATDSRRASDGQPTTNEEVKKVRIKEGKEVRTRFQSPTLDEVKLLASAAGLPSTEADKFFNYYESIGWRVGRYQMKSVPHALKTWKLRNDQNTHASNRHNRTDRNAGENLFKLLGCFRFSVIGFHCRHCEASALNVRGAEG
jgi:hypothetical protein